MPSDKDMGNSEVGHNALGAGRVFEQGAAGSLVALLGILAVAAPALVVSLPRPSMAVAAGILTAELHLGTTVWFLASASS